jgi:hypothetical protein
MVLSMISSSLAVTAQDGQYIDWSTARKLTWNDYLASPDKHSDAAATTSTALGIEYRLRNNNVTHTIICRFSKIKSWGRFKTDYILAHEQGHFDITEVFARKLHKAMMAYEFNTASYKNDLNKIYEDVVKEKQDFQIAYDIETQHSQNKEKQKEWQKKIEKMLDDYKEYANYNLE